MHVYEKEEGNMKLHKKVKNALLLAVFSLFAGLTLIGLTGCVVSKHYMQKFNVSDLSLGMTEEQVKELWGEPTRTTTMVNSLGVYKVWEYTYCTYADKLVYFKDGILTMIQDI